jgi:hypothetical protein
MTDTRARAHVGGIHCRPGKAVETLFCTFAHTFRPCTRIQPSIVITTLHTPPLTLSHTTKPCCTLPHPPAFHTYNALLLTSRTFPPSHRLLTPHVPILSLCTFTATPMLPRTSSFNPNTLTCTLIPCDYPHVNSNIPPPRHLRSHNAGTE